MRKKKTVAAKVKQLRELLAGKRMALIILQDNPDPDAIGSAMGLKALLGKVGEIRTTIAYGGEIGRAENRAMVELLGVKLTPMAEVDRASFDLVAMVDTQPAANNSLEENDESSPPTPTVVVDHHPRRPELRKVTYAHVDTRYGAAATMITEYLFHLGITPDKKTATALVYGIKTDTAGLTRKTSLADREAMQYLYPLHLPEVLARIESEKVPRDYFKDFNKAIEEATIYGKVVFANLGKVQTQETVGEIADFLLRLEETEVVLVVGVHEGMLALSCRTEEGGTHDAGAIMETVVGEQGSGGGHRTMAGGRIPLPKRSTRKDQDDEARQVETRLINLFGMTRKDQKDLV